MPIALQAAERDGKFSDALRNVLFGPQNGTAFGEDLASRNIYRGRDLGYGSWASLVECWGTTPGTSDVPDTVEDIFPHLLGDNPPDGGVLGETLRAIILDQFARSFFASDGDWYEGKDLGQFDQEVRSTTLAQVVNANSDANVQADMFYA